MRNAEQKGSKNIETGSPSPTLFAPTKAGNNFIVSFQTNSGRRTLSLRMLVMHQPLATKAALDSEWQERRNQRCLVAPFNSAE